MTLKAAFVVLATVGVKEADTSWVNQMARSPHPESAWTARQKWYAYEICVRYKDRLSAHGYDISQIPKPSNPSEKLDVKPAVVSAIQKAVLTRRIVMVESGHYHLIFPKDEVVNHELQVAVPNRLRSWLEKKNCWKVKFHVEQIDGPALVAFRTFLKKWQFHGPKTTKDDMQFLLGLALKQENEREAAYQKSFAVDAELNIPTLNGTLRGFQKAGVLYAIEKKRLFIADTMGLGKTIQSIAVVEHQQAFPALFICKASLRKNWMKELYNWLPHRKATTNPKDMQYRFMEILVLSYEGAVRHYDTIEEVGWQAITCDESQFLKHHRTKRTQACKDLAKFSKAPIRMCLTGTPIEIAPYDLAPQLVFLGQMEAMGGSEHFYRHFCNGDTRGSANLEEMNALLRKNCYIRRLKEDVLKELPPKQRTFQPLEIDNMDEYKRAKEDIIAWLKGEVARDPDAYEVDPDALVEGDTVAAKQEHAANKAKGAEALVKIGLLKRIAMRGMLEGAKAWIEDFIESGEKLVVFAHHIEAQQQVFELFKDVAVWTGNHGSQAAVDAFQTNPKIKIIVCSMMRDNAGHTLTASSNVCFIERGWTSTIHDQAEDRLHRITQRASVTCWYLVASGTIYEDIDALIEARRRIVDVATNGNAATTQRASIVGDLIRRMAA